MRRQVELLLQDEVFLEQLGLPWESISDGSAWVVIHDFPTHSGYDHSTASIAIRLEAGYPDAALDMVYVFPSLSRKDGKTIPATEARQHLDGKEWQRWSRHYTASNPWKPGENSLETHIYCIQEWFEREFEHVPIAA